MKKLMIIPGTEAVIPVIKAAQEMGIYVITADNRPDNPGHRVSDEYVNVSIIDKEALLKASKELGISGIMTYACDLAAVPVAYVAEQMGLPAAGPYESVCILQNKGRFRKFLYDNGFNTPWAKAYYDREQALKECESFTYPVIVKPADSSSSRGVSVAGNRKELIKAIDYALPDSFSHQFIVEEFLETEGYCSDSDCFVFDGQFKLYTFNSEGFDDRCNNRFCPWWNSWPTMIERKYIEELKSELQRLVTLLDMKTAIYNIATMIATNGKAYIMECSPRSGGFGLTEIIESATGSDMINNLVRYSVGMPVIERFYEGFDKFYFFLGLHSCINGKFKDVWINDDINDNIVQFKLYVSKGTYIYNLKDARDHIGNITLIFDSNEELQKVINNIESFVKVIVE